LGLYIARRNPPFCDGPSYFYSLLNQVSKVLNFGDVALFRPNLIGNLQKLSGSIESGAGIAHNQRVAKRFLIRFADSLQSWVLNRRTTRSERG
jgi:hypothetical protein